MAEIIFYYWPKAAIQLIAREFILSYQGSRFAILDTTKPSLVKMTWIMHVDKRIYSVLWHALVFFSKIPAPIKA